MKHLFYFLFLSPLFFTCQFKIPNEDIQLYHQKVNEAELAIVCEDYPKASAIYQDAFRYKQFPFAIDIYNQMYCAAFAGQEDLMFENAKKLVENKGLPLEVFQKHYKVLQKDEVKWNDFLDWYNVGYQQFMDNVDLDHRLLFQKIQDDDQEFRVYEDRYTTYKAQNEYVDSINANLMHDFFRENGYPTQEMIGVRPQSFPPGFTDYPYIPLRHYFHHLLEDMFEFDFTDLLVEEAKLGHIEPEYLEEFIHLRTPQTTTFTTSKAIGQAVISIFNENPYISKIDSSLLAQIDSSRKTLMLEDTKSLYAKAIYSLNNRYITPFKLKSTSYINTYHLKYPEQETIAVKIHQVVPIGDRNQYIDCDY